MCGFNAALNFDSTMGASPDRDKTTRGGSFKTLRRMRECAFLSKWRRGISLSLCATSGTSRTTARAAARIQSSWNVPSEWHALIVYCSPAALEYLALGIAAVIRPLNYMCTCARLAGRGRSNCIRRDKVARIIADTIAKRFRNRVRNFHW
jgi:hypothetical protein